jgi:hypothetical protein
MPSDRREAGMTRRRLADEERLRQLRAQKPEWIRQRWDNENRREQRHLDPDLYEQILGRRSEAPWGFIGDRGYDEPGLFPDDYDQPMHDFDSDWWSWDRRRWPTDTMVRTHNLRTQPGWEQRLDEEGLPPRGTSRNIIRDDGRGRGSRDKVWEEGGRLGYPHPETRGNVAEYIQSQIPPDPPVSVVTPYSSALSGMYQDDLGLAEAAESRRIGAIELALQRFLAEQSDADYPGSYPARP